MTMGGGTLEAAVSKAMASPAAADLLGIAAYLAPRRIPLDLLAAAGRTAAVAELKAAGIVTDEVLEEGTAGFAVPPEAQALVRQRHAAEGRDAEYLGRALRLVADAYPKGDAPAKPASWPRCEALNRHAQSVLAAASDDGADAALTSDLLHRLAHYLFARGRYEEAEPVVRRSGAIDEILFGADHPQVGQDRANLAILLHEMGRTSEALPHIHRAIEIGETSLGPEHPIVAERYGIMAALLEELGRPCEADPLIRHAVLSAERSLGPEHPDTRSYRQSYDRIVAAIDDLARRDEAVEEGRAPAPPERLSRHDIPPPPARPKRGVLARLLRGKA